MPLSHRTSMRRIAAAAATLGVVSVLAVAAAAPASAEITAGEVEVSQSFVSYDDNDSNGYLSAADTVYFDVTTTWTNQNSSEVLLSIGYVSIVVGGNEIVLVGDKEAVGDRIGSVYYSTASPSYTHRVEVSMSDLSGMEDGDGRLPYRFAVGVHPEFAADTTASIVKRTPLQADLYDLAPAPVPDVDPDDLVITSVATAWNDIDDSGDVSDSDNLTYTVTVRNDGPVPADLEFVSVRIAGTSLAISANLAGTTSISPGDSVVFTGLTVHSMGMLGLLSNANAYEFTAIAFAQPYTGDDGAPKVTAIGSEGRTFGDDIAVSSSDLTATHTVDSYDDNDASGDLSMGDRAYFTVSVENAAIAPVDINEIQFRTMGGDFSLLAGSDVIDTVPAGGSRDFSVDMTITDAIAGSRDGGGNLGFWLRVLASSDGTAVGDIETLTQADSIAVADNALISPDDLTVSQTYESFEDINGNGVMDEGDFLNFTVTVANANTAHAADIWRVILHTMGGNSEGIDTVPPVVYSVPAGGSLDIPARVELTADVLAGIKADGTLPYRFNVRAAVLPSTVDPTTSKVTATSTMGGDLLSLEIVEPGDLSVTPEFVSYEDVNGNRKADAGDVMRFSLTLSNGAAVKADVRQLVLSAGGVLSPDLAGLNLVIAPGGSVVVPVEVTLTDAMLAAVGSGEALPFHFTLTVGERPAETAPGAVDVQVLSAGAPDLTALAVFEPEPELAGEADALPQTGVGDTVTLAAGAALLSILAGALVAGARRRRMA